MNMKNNTALKLTVFIIIFSLLLSALAGCSKDPADVSSGADDSAADQSEGSSAEEGKIRIDIADQTFWVNGVNADGDDGETLLFDRDYRDENGPALYVNGTSEGRTLISVKLAFKYGSPDYSVISSEVGAHEDVKMPIPVNGFVLSVSTSALPEGYKPNSVSNVTVSGWEYPEYELTDLTTAVPSARSNTRRVNMTDPESGVFEEGKIYFCKKAYTVPQDSAAVILRDPSAGYYRIDSVAGSGAAVDAKYSLLFTGAYNAAYAKEFFASGEVHFSNENLLNGISDSPAVAFSRGEYIVIPRGNVNPETAENGVYLYEISGNASVTNAKGDFTNIVVRGGKVAYVSNKSENVVIPSSDGYVVTFAGESKTLCEGVEMGDSVKDLLIATQDLPAMFVRVKSLVFEIDSLNVPLNNIHPCVLYTPEYGAATGSADCAEIAIEDGRIVSVTKAGNSAIPENGYVLSVKKGSQNYASVANRSSEGDPALVSLGGNMYSFTTFHYNATNATRQTDYIVIYNDSFGKSTATNVYGYEFAVDANGSITGSSYAGNMQIPRGGFVVSAHGANIQTLEKAYSYGAKVTLDKSRNNVTVQTTPESLFYDAEFRYNDLKTGYEDALERLLSIDTASIGPKVELITSVYDAYLERKGTDSPEKSVERCRTIISMCEDLRFSMYESAPVENRAVWYRCNEKNDDEVRASCELMAQMGINAVYLETWYNGQFIGYSENPLIKHVSTHGDYDVLEGYCRIAHEYGIEVHCWVENFFIGSNGVLVDATKEYHLLDNKGKDYQPTMYGNFVFLDPLDDRSRKLVLDLYREILTKYDVDGLNLDYIRFP
ncbi:MAG: family 10 glycosylhydrolase, partial [Clostridia bacterium]|nr:family 10 glycosylhydrolase [Clostridia bacterium]